MNIFKHALHLLLPKLCQLCERRVKNGPICARCLAIPIHHQSRCTRCSSNSSDLDPNGVCHLCKLYPPIPERLIYLWDYEGSARELVRIAKYTPSKATSRKLGQLLSHHLRRIGAPFCWDMIVPIPSSVPALKKRGFNPCMVMAGAIAEEFPIPIEPGALIHQGYRHRQASLKGGQRIRNVRKAFGANRSLVEGRSILLVEDVVTTGATITAACRELMLAGAASVDVAALARVPSWNTFRLAVHERITSPKSR